MIMGVMGEYGIEVNAETVTKAAKSSNSTSELYKAKGTRFVFANEPENGEDSKLQVGLIKKICDGYKHKIKTRGLYQDATEFNIFFRFEMTCNKMPTLSCVDGGIARRLRTVNYPVKFVENPVEGNKYQAKLDCKACDELTSIDARNAYMYLLVKHFIKSKKITKEVVPKSMVDKANDFIEDCDEVLGFITQYYTITNDTNDKVGAQKLFERFKACTKSKMTTSSFKEDLLRIGVEWKREKKGVFYIGIKQCVDDDSDEE